MTNRATKWMTGAAALALMVTVAGCGAATTNNTTGAGSTGNTTGSGSQSITINETGSSLLYPLFNGQWISAYQSVAPNVHIIAASTGSGTGISQAIAGTVQIGASDAYMSDSQMASNPTIVNIPLAISAQQIMYNLPGMSTSSHLKLTGNVLGEIYLGKIKYWDDPAIAQLNPSVKLPHHLIIPVHRTDGSGDTFLFTQFLTDTNSTWKSQVQFGTSVSWPSVSGGIGANGNQGVVASMHSNPYSIGYVGISWLDTAVKEGIGYAQLQNKAGNYVLPTQSNIEAAASQMVDKVPADERISLIYAPGANSYPIINFEYAIVNTKQPTAMASALKTFFDWAINPQQGNSAQYLKPVHFLPLPASVAPKSQAQINKIGS